MNLGNNCQTYKKLHNLEKIIYELDKQKHDDE
jgi:hypothetical protein